VVVGRLNRKLIGWANYFCLGRVSPAYRAIDSHVRRTSQGDRDHALLLFLYNTGARASEAAHRTVGDLDFTSGTVRIVGKGRKQRQYLLWQESIQALRALAGARLSQEHGFLNRCGHPLKCEVTDHPKVTRRWANDPALMAFLRSL